MKWPRQADCLQLFGNPFEEGWSAKHIVYVRPPFAISMGATHIGAIAINRIAAESLALVFAHINDACGHDGKKIAAAHCDRFSGSFALRSMRGSKSISMHAYGLALDFDAPANELGAPVGKTFFKPDSIIVRAFKSEGWIWGGDWTGRRDAMHFQAARP